MRFPLRIACLTLCAGAPCAYGAGVALPSSHREAPFITEMPKVDATDFYMFRSYEPGRDGYVTIVANYQPFQTPYGGPNFFQMDDDAIYQIHIDNDGDAREDLTFEFQFVNKLKDLALTIGGQTVSVPLYNIGPIGPGATQTDLLNITERYSLRLRHGDQYTGPSVNLANASGGGTVFSKPADNPGTKSIPGYETYARKHIHTIALPGTSLTGRVFVGQRRDPFVVNLGEVFDLVNTNPLGPVDAEPNVLEDANVTSLVLELPIDFLTAGGNGPVIGGWTTASVKRARVLRVPPSYASPAFEEGPWVQVSRLGMPLVNEVVIGLKDKDRFNNSRPRNDAQFLTYVTNPSLPELLEILFPAVQAPCLPRNDLVGAFLTGVEGLNQPAGVVPAEMLRLNTSIAPKAKGEQSPFGVLAGDTAGFPNGRRPGDDVVDAALRVVMGALISNTQCAPSGNLPFTDGALCTDQLFDAVFPYLRTPVAASPN